MWSSAFNFKTRLPAHTTVFTAELTAIHLALKFIESLPGEFIIFSDSLSSLTALQSTACSQHYLLVRIRKLIHNFPEGKVYLHWIPSHVGIPGNERADALAKESLSMQTPPASFIPNPDLRSLVHRVQRQLWQQWWTLQRPSQYLPDLLSEAPFTEGLTRREQVCIARLRLQTCLLTHSHLFKKEIPAECETCHVQLTLTHLLIDCRLQEAHRRRLRIMATALNKPFNLTTLLSPDFPASTLLKYLIATGYRNRI